MELETQVQVSTNQLRRQDEEKKTLFNELEEVQIKVREMMTKHKEQNHRLSDLQTKVSIFQKTRNPPGNSEEAGFLLLALNNLYTGFLFSRKCYMTFRKFPSVEFQ